MGLQPPGFGAVEQEGDWFSYGDASADHGYSPR